MPLSDEEIDKKYDIASQLYESDKFEECFGIYKELADEGLSYCQLYIGKEYCWGLGVEENLELGEEYLTKAALQENVEALFFLGKLFFKKKQYGKALEWFEKSASFEFPPAIYKVGWFYERGRYVQKNKRLALKMFKKAADSGHMPAKIEYNREMILGHGGVMEIFKGIVSFFKILWEMWRLDIEGKDSDRFLR